MYQFGPFLPVPLYRDIVFVVIILILTHSSRELRLKSLTISFSEDFKTFQGDQARLRCL